MRKSVEIRPEKAVAPLAYKGAVLGVSAEHRFLFAALEYVERNESLKSVNLTELGKLADMDFADIRRNFC